jgi:hypothetical protein
VRAGATVVGGPATVGDVVGAGAGRDLPGTDLGGRAPVGSGATVGGAVVGAGRTGADSDDGGCAGPSVPP